jgi:hypothetical protein
MLSTTTEQAREQRARHRLRRQGYRLAKSRTRTPEAIDYGCYMIVDIRYNPAVAGTEGTGRPNMSLDDVERWLASE